MNLTRLRAYTNYKMSKFYRNKVHCTEYQTRFTFFNKWLSGKSKYPYCS